MALHEHWREYTAEDVRKLQEENDCVNCKYSKHINNATSLPVKMCTCDYLLMTGKRRGCSPDGCTKFEKR